MLKYFKIVVLFIGFCMYGQEPSPYKLVVFEGSDWCVYCLKLEKNVLSHPEFTAYLTKEHIELEKIDFPQKAKQSDEVKRYNEKVAEQYQFKGRFPTLVLVNTKTGKYTNVKRKKTPEKQILEIGKDLKQL